MTSRARDILVRFLGDDKSLKQVNKNTESGLGRLQQSFGGLTTIVKTFVATKAVDFLKDMAEAAAEDATQQTKLATVLRNTVGATDEQIASVEKWITSMQMATNVADTDLRQALQSLTVAGMSVADSQQAISVAVDIAAARGLDLTSVINGFVKAQIGNVAGLARLGIATKDAAGETLSFDQILANAAETMGGTARRAAFDLAGQLEQVNIAFGELQESQPALARMWARIREGVLLAAESIADFKNELPEARTLLNELIRQGIDPFAERVPATIAVLSELSGRFADVNDAAEFLQVALGTTQQDLIAARGAIISYGDGWGYSADQIRIMLEALEAQIGIAEPAILATRRHQAAMTDAATATRDFTTALAEQRDGMKEATDPVFAAEKANDRLTAAHDKYTRAVIESGTGSEEARTALADLLGAQRDVESAQAGLKEAFGPDSVAALQAWGDQMGINRDVLAEWINDMLFLAGLPPIALPAQPGNPGNPRTSIATSVTVTEPSPGNRRGQTELTRTVINNYNNFSFNDTADAQRQILTTNQRQLDRLARETVR